MISYQDGEAGASSTLPSRRASQAFALGQMGYYLPWSNMPDEKFPHTVWWQFPESVIVARFAFSSRDRCCLEQSPTEFQLVASNDGQAWNVLQTYYTKFTKLSQEKAFLVPAEVQGAFTYYGIKTLKVTKNVFVSIKRLKMWRNPTTTTGKHPGNMR